MTSLSAEAFSFGQLMIAAATGAVVASAMVFLLAWAKHDELMAKLRFAEDGHRQARRLLALQRSPAACLTDGRPAQVESGRLPHGGFQHVLRGPTHTFKQLQSR